MEGSSYRPSAAFVEDYDSEGNTVLPQTRKYAKSSGSTGNFKVQVKGDGHSDSGYSSHTAATVNSADWSGTSSQNQEKRFTLPLRSASKPSNSSSQPRPTLLTRPENLSAESAQKSPRKQSARTPSARSPRKPIPEPVAEYEYQERRTQRERPSPLESPLDINYAPFDSYSGRDEAMPSLNSRAYREGYEEEVPAPRPRTSSGASRRSRPSSYHPGMPYNMAGSYDSSNRNMMPNMGPPPAPSAFAHAPHYIPPSYPPPTTSFLSPFPQIPPKQVYGPVYNYNANTSRQMRPPPQQWATEPYGAQLSYPRPSAIDYDYPISSTAVTGAVPISRHGSLRPEPIDDYYSYERPTDKELMPPPKSRPRVHHTATAPSGGDIPRPLSAAPREGRQTIQPGLSRARSKRSQSTNRPPLSQRTTYADPERRNRRSSVYYEDGPGPTSGTTERDRARNAENYQDEVTRAAPKASVPVTTETIRNARRSNQPTSKNPRSDGGSGSRSSGSGSDGKPRDGEGSFTMRFKQNANINLDLSGDTEGRPLNLRQAEDGKMELSIGGSSKKYVDGSQGTRTDYARSTGSRRDDERSRRKELRGERRSGRSSRAGDQY
ncbi:MAG: hypothetical protein M1814_004456 [Vezdaea aestivalis]|nr:MAG: hypothetical protein M1814_004456 [Vezdaea aestivalis]